MKKKVVSFICAFVLSACCFPMDSQAKVIEPEVVKTESWTTSYYIDDDIDTLYPYIQCEADIYNDGSIMLYMWNTHEWDGFGTISHKVALVDIGLCSSNSPQYSAKFGRDYIDPDDKQKTYKFYPDKNIDDIDISYYPETYKTGMGGKGNLLLDIFGYHPQSDTIANLSADGYSRYVVLSRSYWNCTLEKLPVYTSRTQASSVQIVPQVVPTGTNKFRLYGHDITITPELLSGNIVATPQLTEQEKYIQQLEAENAALKAENEKLKSQISILSTAKFGDVNQDGIVGVEDAQLVLMYYTETIAGLVKDEPIEDWYAKRNTI